MPVIEIRIDPEQVDPRNPILKELYVELQAFMVKAMHKATGREYPLGDIEVHGVVIHGGVNTAGLVLDVKPGYPSGCDDIMKQKIRVDLCKELRGFMDAFMCLRDDTYKVDIEINPNSTSGATILYSNDGTITVLGTWGGVEFG